MFQIAKEAEEFEEEQAKLLEENPYVNHNAAMLKAVLKEKGKNFILCIIFLMCICTIVIFINCILLIYIFILLHTFLSFLFL